MQLSRLLSRARISIFPSQSPFQSVSGILCYSTKITLKSKRNSEEESLYRRISPVGNPNDSIVPVLDKWVEEGGDLNRRSLYYMIKELRHYRRFKHALEICQWMHDKRFMHVTVQSVAVRLDLIAKVHGVEEAENYFNSTREKLRTLEVYGALLNCYTFAKCVDKAEGVMQKMRDMGFASASVTYNVLLNLYCQTDNHEKLDALVHEMEAKKIKFDCYTYSILFNAYGKVSGIDRIEKLLTEMESDPKLTIDWQTYAVVARQYLRAGFVEKALKPLKKSETLIGLANKRNEAFSHILTLYAAAGKKDEVLRVWKICKMYKVTNRDYMTVLPVILKFNDIKAAEDIFNEWEASDLSKDPRVPMILIRFYCKQGLMEKAEALIGREKAKEWHMPDSWTWSWMSSSYLRSNQLSKAVDAMESALFEFQPGKSWEPDQETLAACLKYVKDEGNVERLRTLVGLLKDKDFMPAEILSEFA